MTEGVLQEFSVRPLGHCHCLAILIHLIFDAFVTIVISVYLLLERSEIKAFLVKVANAFFDSKTNKSIAKYYNKTNHIFFTYITSQVFDAFIVGIIISLVMTWMGIKYATLLGFIIGLFNVIPYFGAIVAILIAFIITIILMAVILVCWYLQQHMYFYKNIISLF